MLRHVTIRLRFLFLLTFALCALLPAAFLAVWISVSQYDRELENTRLKQIALAKTFALALDRFAEDRLLTFQRCADAYFSGRIVPAELDIAAQSGFQYFVSIAPDQTKKILDLHGSVSDRPPLDLMHPISDTAPSSQTVFGRNNRFTTATNAPEDRPFGGKKIKLSPQVERTILTHASSKAMMTAAINDHRGVPTLFITQRGPDGSIIAGALDASPVSKMQQAVSFGMHGHAVVVDRIGQIIGHPRAEWVAALKPMTDIIPVQKAIEGETGAIEFFAPAREESAIAGYTRAQHASMGVLMVRPVAEINAVAWENASISTAVIGAGVAIAFLAAWIMAGVIVRPVERAAITARQLGSGNSTARISPIPAVPAELTELASTLNELAERIDNWRKTAAETLSTVRAADQAQRDFLATLSHEIRTPLNAIIGFGELVEMTAGNSEKDSQTRDYAGSIVSAGRHLLHLIDDILDLAAIEAGELALDMEPVEILPVVQEAAKLLRPTAASHGVTMTIDLKPELPPIAADPGKILQILLNLLGNSIKFTPDGGEVRVSAAHIRPDMLDLSIADTGIGMSQGEIKTALLPFGRVRNAKARKEPGTGLGLPLARRLIETMKGEFELSSQPGQGTSITIRLPVAAT